MVTTRAKLFALVLSGSIVLLVIAGSVISSRAAKSQPRQTPIVIVAGDTSGYPEGCNPGLVADLIMEFFDAYNNGDQEELTGFFSPGLQWYSDTKGGGDLHFVTYDRKELPSYFGERHKQHEQLQLVALNVIEPPRPTASLVHFAYVYRRRATDIQPGPDSTTRIGDGKGAVTCSNDPKIHVWSMGLSTAEDDEKKYDYWSCFDSSGSMEAVPTGTACVKYD